MATTKSNHIYDMSGMSLSENIIKRVGDFNRQNLYISIPARVVNVDDYETLQCVDVKPVINDTYTMHDLETLQSITMRKVFVKHTSGGGFDILPPVEKGGLVTLHWPHRDISTFLDSDGTEDVDQPVEWIAQMEDCWATLGFGTRREHQNPSQKNLLIRGPKTLVTITPEGHITTETAGDVKIIAEGSSYLKSSHHTIDTDVTITKSLVVEKDTTTDGNTLTKGTTTSQGAVEAQAGVFASAFAGIGGAAATFEVDMGITGTVTINGVNVNLHTHVGGTGTMA